MGFAHRSTRREFLQGKAAVDVLAEAAGQATSALGAATSEESYLVKLSRRAMACQFEIFLNAGQHDDDTRWALAALDLVDALEDQLSIFRPHSEISLLNRRASEEAVVVEAGLFSLLELALGVWRETGGAYDVTSAPLSDVWGFKRRAGAIPSAEDLQQALSRVGSRHVELDEATQSIHFLIPGLEINLGSIGKGYALDRCSEVLAGSGVENYLLHGGNSSVLARGSYAARPADGGWLVGLRDPLRPDRRLGQIVLRDAALSTSGSGTQFFMHEGKRYGHILDPRTGWPAEGVLSATVLAPSGAEAEALSTAFYVMGPSGSAAYCQQHPEVRAIMLCPAARAGSLEKHFFGLDAARDWIETEQP